MGFEYHSLATGHFQMPDGWSLTTIQEVAEVNEKAITKRNAPSHIHYIDIASVDKGKLLDIQELPFEKAPSRARRVVRDKDSLIATVRPNLEHYMFVKEPRPNTIASTGFAVVTAKTADPRFLYYYLTSKPFTAYLTQIAESHTSAYPAFNPDVIEKAELVLPSDSEQRAIAHILGSLDDKIELNRRVNRTLEAIARAIFKSWFIDFDPVRAKAEGGDPGLPDGVAALFPDRFEASELGEIPRGWEVKTIGDVTEFTYGKALKASDRKPGDVPVFGSNGQVGLHNEVLVKGPGIVVGRKGNPGIVTWSYEDFFPIDTTFYVKKTGVVSSLNYLFYALKYQDLPRLSADSAVPGLNRNLAYMSKFLVPSEKVLKVFDGQIDPLFQTIYANEKEIKTLASLRDTLLPKLISGELRVPDAEKFVEEAGV